MSFYHHGIFHICIFCTFLYRGRYHNHFNNMTLLLMLAVAGRCRFLGLWENYDCVYAPPLRNAWLFFAVSLSWKRFYSSVCVRSPLLTSLPSIMQLLSNQSDGTVGGTAEWRGCICAQIIKFEVDLGSAHWINQKDWYLGAQRLINWSTDQIFFRQVVNQIESNWSKPL